MNELILGVKIRDRKTGLYMLKDGRLSKNGKTYSTLGFAKSSITNKTYIYNDNYKKWLNYDFVLLKDYGSIEMIPVKEHIIDLFNRKLKENIERKEYYDSKGYKDISYTKEYIEFYTKALKELNEV